MPRKQRKLDPRKVRRPRPGDTSLFSDVLPPILARRKNEPDPHAKPKRGKGKVIGWYEICGARAKIWVHGASDDDACGTFRVSKLSKSKDDPPKPTSRFKRELEEGDYGIVRYGPHHTVEVNWRNEGEIIEAMKKRRQKQRQARQRRESRERAAQVAA